MRNEKERRKWEIPTTDAELREEIAFWRWALKYSKGTPAEHEHASRFRECVWARNRLAQKETPPLLTK